MTFLVRKTFVTFFLLASIAAKAGEKDSVVHYSLPDSVKAVQFMAGIKILSVSGEKELTAGIQTDAVKLFLKAGNNEKEIVFQFADTATIIANGLHTDTRKKGEIVWPYSWKPTLAYELLIATAADSAGNFSVYSGYAWLPEEKKWKLVGTCRINGIWHPIHDPASFYNASEKAGIPVSMGQPWVQRQNGTWKSLDNETIPSPLVNLYNHMDSLEQQAIDKKLIETAISAGKTDAKDIHDGIYYTMMKDGTGRQVNINDTITVFYKGYLFTNDSVFSQSIDKPATFPLKALIRGWQIVIPLCKVGGKIKLVIPSDLAYSIRTRSAKIPPNSILVFEVEVLDAKAPQ